MLRVALPNKGSLSDKAIELVKEAGYKCGRWGKELIIIDTHHNIEFYFLRPKDIAVYVSRGFIDLGITGRDLMIDSMVSLSELLPLNFGQSTFRFAAENSFEFSGLNDLKNKRIACSYPNLVRQYLDNHGVQAEITKLDGAVEISIKLGVADIIADVVESGKTLKEAGLKVIGGEILKSEAILVSKNSDITHKCRDAATFIKRLNGILVARQYVMIEYDIPRNSLEQACEITCGIESPTVANLRDPEWFSVKAMIEKKSVNHTMDEIADIGAKGIIITEIKTCRL